MAQAAAEHARNTAAASLKDSVRELQRYKDKPPHNRRLLQKKLDKVLNFKDELVDRHYIYGDKSGLELDADEMLQ